MNRIKVEHFAYHAAIEKILLATLGDTKCRVYLFGSRAAGTANLTSDIDLGVLADEPVGRALSLARESLAESTIPLKVDLVDLSQTNAEFREEALQEGILLWVN